MFSPFSQEWTHEAEQFQQFYRKRPSSWSLCLNHNIQGVDFFFKFGPPATCFSVYNV